MTNLRLQKRDVGRSACGRARSFEARIDSRRIWRVFFITIIACWIFLSATPRALSQKEEGAEYPVKLAFLYNFTKFVEWPSDTYRDPSAPLAICIVGRSPFSQELEGELRTRKVGARPVDVKTLKPNDKLSACQIVFVPVTEKDHAEKIVTGLKGSRTLTVGETEGFAVLGGMINLTVEANKVHFEVNPLAAERAGLKISSRLLNIAKIVKEQNRGRKI